MLWLLNIHQKMCYWSELSLLGKQVMELEGYWKIIKSEKIGQRRKTSQLLNVSTKWSHRNMDFNGECTHFGKKDILI